MLRQYGNWTFPAGIILFVLLTAGFCLLVPGSSALERLRDDEGNAAICRKFGVQAAGLEACKQDIRQIRHKRQRGEVMFL